MRFVLHLALLAAPAALAACSATETATERAAPTSEAVPAEVNSDAARRDIYNANGRRQSAAVPAVAVPDATPNTQRLGEQAADINRYKRPESLNTNDPNLTSPESRMQTLDRPATAPQRQP